MLLEPYTLLFPHEREYFEREEKNIPENHLLQEKTGWRPSEVTLPCSALSPASLSLVRSHVGKADGTGLRANTAPWQPKGRRARLSPSARSTPFLTCTARFVWAATRPLDNLISQASLHLGMVICHNAGR